eukprot:GHVP01020008.1.p1 GENE.GHVP01020008.1~~GHVP01020008.1.p1  ORF type:complete len:961 (-),score=174.38 GHVP01020008.1:3587-6445(-)
MNSSSLGPRQVGRNRKRPAANTPVWNLDGPLIFKGKAKRLPVSRIPTIVEGERSILVLPNKKQVSDRRSAAEENLDGGDRFESSSGRPQADPDEEQRLDRLWYTTEEDELMFDEDSFIVDDRLREKETRMKKQQVELASKNRTNIREASRRADQDLWETNRLTQSGVDSDKTFNVDRSFHGANDEVRIQLQTKEFKPYFLADESKLSLNLNAVQIVKDPTSDIALLARKGSKALLRLKQEENQTKMRKRFWELAGSQLGELLGVQNQPTAEEIAESQIDGDSIDYKKSSQYAEALKQQSGSNATDFSRNLSIKQQRRSLPIFDKREELLRLIRESQVVIVLGQTGSGKTTQLAQYLYEEGYGTDGIIGCTQPRRVAAVSVAKRVSEEMGVELGKSVGYSIRFEDCTSLETKIKYMTDGVLLRESLTDPELDNYSAIIMDEAHERSLHTDVLFGIFKNVVARRRDLRLIVTSATMNADKFSDYFAGAPKFEIPGRTFPVRVEYMKSPPDDYVDAAVQKCLEIHCSSSVNDGDILIFMTGQDDIEGTCYLIVERMAQLTSTRESVQPLTVLPIYSTLPADIQAKVFEPSQHRKVIVATNIAETSLTLDGVRYVIDTGFCKLKVYNPRVGMDSLQVTPISHANAQQRSGRAGRTGPGICHRLYTERVYVGEMFENSIPEIQRSNLASVILLLKSLGFESLLAFDFMDPPSRDTIVSSMYQLWMLGGLDDGGNLTEVGRKMSLLPCDPPLARMLLESDQNECLEEMVTIVAMLSVPSIFYRPKERSEESDASRERFYIVESDHLTLLNVFLQWKNHSYSPTWCSEFFIHYKALKRVREIRSQHIDVLQSMEIESKSCGQDWDILRKVICVGYTHHVCKMKGVGEYVNLLTSIACYLHPSSSIYSAGYTPEYLVYHEVVLTTKEFIQHATAVCPTWLEDQAPKMYYCKSVGSSTGRI